MTRGGSGGGGSLAEDLASDDRGDLRGQGARGKEPKTGALGHPTIKTSTSHIGSVQYKYVSSHLFARILHCLFCLHRTKIGKYF